MAAGELLSSSDRLALDTAIRRAEELSRFEFSVFVGAHEGDDAREYASRLHNRLVAPARSVLVMVDPGRRVVEVVTGAEVRRHLTDAEVDLAILAMHEDLSEGRLAPALARGIDMLAAHALP